jgi:hypothetical protein
LEKSRHCEERSDEAIQGASTVLCPWIALPQARLAMTVRGQETPRLLE